MLQWMLDNTRKPQDNLQGRIMLQGMNSGHNPMAKWALKALKVPKNSQILDVGCGGGRNIANMLPMTENVVWGLDYSEASVKFAKRYNYKAIEHGRAKVVEGDVQELPFPEGQFGAVTAFETVYFWPDPKENFKEVHRVLQPGGKFLVANEDGETKEGENWKEYIEMEVYTRADLVDFMKEAGFVNIKTALHKNGKFLYVMGTKE